MDPREAVSALDLRMDAGSRPWLHARELGGIPILEARLPGLFRACFTTRIGLAGGDGDGSFDLDPRSEERKGRAGAGRVTSNRALIEKTIRKKLISPSQVHGVRVVGVSEYVLEERGTPCDGLTIHQDIDMELAAGLLFADCVPVVLCGEVDMAVVHGGWRGILGGIVQQGGRSMMGAPATLVIGPSIGPCCFAVENEVAEAFGRRYGPEVVLASGASDESPRVDLWEAVAKAASELGVQRMHVVNPRLCTVCNNDLFYSYRAEGEGAGRHGCVGWISET